MSKQFACIMTKDKKVLTHKYHSHEEIVKEYNLKDGTSKNRSWLRIEVIPEDDNYASDVVIWKFIVDEKDILPEWFELNKKAYENLCRKTAKEWQRTCVDKLGYFVTE